LAKSSKVDAIGTVFNEQMLMSALYDGPYDIWNTNSINAFGSKVPVTQDQITKLEQINQTINPVDDNPTDTVYTTNITDGTQGCGTLFCMFTPGTVNSNTSVNTSNLNVVFYGPLYDISTYKFNLIHQLHRIIETSPSLISNYLKLT